MHKRILLPLDGSDLANRIIRQARPLLVHPDHEVVLLTVMDQATPTPWSVAAAEAHLEGARAALAAQGARAVRRLAIGDPAAEILAASRDAGVDLIVMSTHGRSGLRRVIRGSVAEQVIRRSEVPVLTANSRALKGDEAELRLRRILVPLDLSDEARTVLPVVEEVASLFGSQVILLTVDTIPPVVGLGEAPPRNAPARLQEALTLDADRLRSGGIDVRSVVAYGPVAATILDIVGREQADLVALATHGRGGIARAVLGSTTETLLRTCKVPLLIRRVTPAGALSRSARRRARG